MTMDNPFTYSAYSAYLKEHRFMGSKDSASGEVFFPPRPINPASFSTDMEWVEFSGEGILTSLHHRLYWHSCYVRLLVITVRTPIVSEL
jgi:uncharacterized OB-fold protein